MNSMSRIRFAIIGCGAVTELFYLPTFRRLSDAYVTLLVDTSAERREHLASMFDIEYTHTDFDKCYDLFDAAIVALPGALHAPVSIKLLAQRKAALVEIPMAISVAECDEMNHVAEQAGSLLAVALKRRFIWSHCLASSLLKNGALGPIKSFDFREGIIYDWPVTSDFPFRKEAAGGGVLIDAGTHVLDFLLHLLGDFIEVEYFDDSEGGVEANCLLNIRLVNKICGVVELSRTRQLRNTAIIRGEQGAIEVGLDQNNLKLSISDQPYALNGSVVDLKNPDKGQDYSELFKMQIEDFIAAIRNGHQPHADGRSAKSSIKLIETCYSRRQPLQLPWRHRDLNTNG